jgi:di/tricarboxylate transporter
MPHPRRLPGRRIPPRPAGGTRRLIAAALLTALTIGLWATGWLPEYLTALIFFALAMIAGVAPAPTIFAGFASSAFWLVLSGYVIGIAVRNTGLADRVARSVTARLSGSYPRLVAGVVVMTYALAFVMPSNMGRIAVLMPIVLAVADRAGLPPGNRGRTGLALAVGFGTFMLSASILPANVPNLVLAGSIEADYGIRLTYLPYLVLHAPVLGLLKGVALVGCICLLFAARPRPIAADPSTDRLSPPEQRLAALLAVTLLLWLTDSVHGISPAWIGLAAACVCLWPRAGFVSHEEFGTQVNFRTAIYVAGILGMAAMVTRSGLGDLLGHALLAVAPLDPAAPRRSFAALVGISSLLNFVVTSNGVPALYTPLARALAKASGLPLATVLMVQVIGFSTTVLPYQAAPIVVAVQMGGVRAAAAVRLSLSLAAITFAVLVPLDCLWFELLGWM